MYSIKLSTETKVLITSALFFLPITLSGVSYRGFFMILLFFLINGLSPKIKELSIKYIPRFLISIILVWSIYSIPVGLIEIFKSNFEVLKVSYENLFYAFKKISFFGYDANYIGTLLVIFAINKPKKIYLILLLFTGNRASIIAFLITKIIALSKIKIYKYVLSYFLIFGILLTLVGLFHNGDLAALSSLLGNSIAYKIQTNYNLVEVISNGDLNTLFFGNGISDLALEKLSRGHTLAGVIVKNGLFYIIFSLLIFYFSLDLSEDKGKQIFFAVFIIAIFSTTSFNFVSPLVYSLSKQSFIEKESNKNKINR